MHKPKPQTQEAPSPAQVSERANQCLYTSQEAYSTAWEKNLNQANLIESLKKRIDMLEERLKQKDAPSLPIPAFTVEPLAQTGIYQPFERCMNRLSVKSIEELKTENSKQETDIISLHKRMTDLMKKLQAR